MHHDGSLRTQLRLGASNLRYLDEDIGGGGGKRASPLPRPRAAEARAAPEVPADPKP